jgi:hypothetical protein
MEKLFAVLGMLASAGKGKKSAQLPVKAAGIAMAVVSIVVIG